MAVSSAWRFQWLAIGFTIASGLINSDFRCRRNHLSCLRSSRFEDDSSIRPWSSISNPDDLFSKWGVTREDRYRDFPNTIELVIEEAFEAIAGTIYGKSAMDPNIASNARSTSIFTNRPVRSKNDAGRIGLEMDGLRSLFPGEKSLSQGQSMRRAALMLAGKLSMDASWNSFHQRHSKKAMKANGLGTRPILVYFNSVKEALWASRELQNLKSTDNHCIYDNVRILCLSDGIPNDMRLDRSDRRRWGGLSKGYVNARRGFFVLVQPTDFNTEHTPPGPAVGSINSFQKIVAQASIEEIPIIAFSPRYLNSESPFEVRRDQSGYQQSAVYGGLEPPKGPTPWVMRDFTPPVFCWIGNAVQLGSSPRRNCAIPRIALSQSVMDQGHLWHMFTARECAQDDMKTRTTTVEYHYLASTISASGRPTRDLMKLIFSKSGQRH